MPCSSFRQVNRKKSPGTSSRFFGVYWYAPRKRPDRRGWRAMIRIGGKPKVLGLFASEIDAALAYIAAAEKYYGKPVRVDDPALLEAKKEATVETAADLK